MVRLDGIFGQYSRMARTQTRRPRPRNKRKARKSRRRQSQNRRTMRGGLFGLCAAQKRQIKNLTQHLQACAAELERCKAGRGSELRRTPTDRLPLPPGARGGIRGVTPSMSSRGSAVAVPSDPEYQASGSEIYEVPQPAASDYAVARAAPVYQRAAVSDYALARAAPRATGFYDAPQAQAQAQVPRPPPVPAAPAPPPINPAASNQFYAPSRRGIDARGAAPRQSQL